MKRRVRQQQIIGLVQRVEHLQPVGAEAVGQVLAARIDDMRADHLAAQQHPAREEPRIPVTEDVVHFGRAEAQPGLAEMRGAQDLVPGIVKPPIASRW